MVGEGLISIQIPIGVRFLPSGFGEEVTISLDHFHSMNYIIRPYELHDDILCNC